MGALSNPMNAEMAGLIRVTGYLPLAYVTRWGPYKPKQVVVNRPGMPGTIIDCIIGSSL